MYKFSSAILSLATLTLVMPALASAAPSPSPQVVAVPSQCEGMTFDHTFNFPSGHKAEGTSGRDLIAAGDGDVVDAKGGDDCIVVANATSVKAGDGKDVVVVSGSGNKVSGGNQDDKLYALAAGNKLLGESGDDYLSGVSTTAVDGGPGTDECHTDAAGRQTNCEPTLTLLAQVLSALGL